MHEASLFRRTFVALVVATAVGTLVPCVASPAEAATTASAQQLIYPNAAAQGGLFGQYVSMSETALAVGSPGISTVFVYTKSNGNWANPATLVGPAGSDRFGRTVAVDGDHLAVHVRLPATPSCTGDANYGVLMYTRSGSSWTQTATLLPTQPVYPCGVDWGTRIALVGNRLLIGSAYGDQAYIFDGTTWNPTRFFYNLGNGRTASAYVALSRSGQSFAIGAGAGAQLGTWAADGTMTLTSWVPALYTAATASVFDLDDQTLIIGSPLWLNASGQRVGAIAVYPIGSTTPSFTAQGTFVAGASQPRFGQTVAITGASILAGSANGSVVRYDRTTYATLTTYNRPALWLEGSTLNGQLPWNSTQFAIGDYTSSGPSHLTNSGMVAVFGLPGEAQPPVVTVTGVANGATYELGAVPSTACSVHDAIDGDLVTSAVTTGGNADGTGAFVTNCTYTASTGLTGSASVTYTVSDTTPPVVHASGAQTVEATSSAGASVTFTASAADVGRATAPPVACSPASGSTFPIGTTTVTCQSTDAAGNTGSISFVVTVVDRTAPSVSPIADIQTALDDTGHTSVSYVAPSAIDIVDGAVPVTCNPGSPVIVSSAPVVVTCTASDAAGNSTTTTFTITGIDASAPILQVPADQTIEATGPGGATASWTARATDAVDGTVTPSCDPLSGSTFPLDAATPVTCTARDRSGNTSTASFTITVADTTGPEIQVPADITGMEATGPDGAPVNFAVSAHDIVDGDVPVTCVAGDTAVTSGWTFPLGDTIITCSAVDRHGNIGHAAPFHVTTVDTAPPTAQTPPGIVTEYGSPIIIPPTTATDSVDGQVPLICEAPNDPLPGDHIVSCTATDSAGNVTTVSFTITVVDTTPPSFPALANITVAASTANGQTVTYEAPTAYDLVDGDVPAACSPTSGSNFPLGVTTVTCSSRDAHGNTGAASFTVNVVDDEAPVLDLPANMIIEAAGPSAATVAFTTSALDSIDGDVPVDCDHAPGTTFALGDTLVSCQAHDQTGNVAEGAFIITIRDTTAPDLAVPNSFNVTASTSAGTAITYPAATAIDLVDGFVPTSCTPASGSTFPLGATTVTCYATDTRGNSTFRSFVITLTFGAVTWSTSGATDRPAYKAGSVIPLRFTLNGASGSPVADAVARLTLTRAGSPTEEIVLAASANHSDLGNVFRYVNGIYQFNLSTNGLMPATWIAHLDLGDGVDRSLTFVLV